MTTVLVVEDEIEIARVVRDYLRNAGFEVIVVGDGGSAVASVRSSKPDLLVLDLGLPGRDGLDVAREIRRWSTMPIVMLTARGDETDRIVGLELGADDYVVKPFSPKELVARVRAVLRRTRTAERGDEVLRAEQRMRIEQLETKIAEDFGIGLEDLVNEYGPDVMVPASAAEVAEYQAAKERGEQVSEPQPMPYDRARFPFVTFHDQVAAQHRLVTEHFGIETLALVTGWSMGAGQTYQWAVSHPEMVQRAVPFCGSSVTADHNKVFLYSLGEAMRTEYQAIIDAAGSTPPPEWAELVTMARWRIEHLDWQQKTARQMSHFFDSTSSKTATASAATSTPLKASATP